MSLMKPSLDEALEELNLCIEEDKIVDGCLKDALYRYLCEFKKMEEIHRIYVENVKETIDRKRENLIHAIDPLQDMCTLCDKWTDNKHRMATNVVSPWGKSSTIEGFTACDDCQKLFRFLGWAWPAELPCHPDITTGEYIKILWKNFLDTKLS